MFSSCMGLVTNLLDRDHLDYSSSQKFILEQAGHPNSEG